MASRRDLENGVGAAFRAESKTAPTPSSAGRAGCAVLFAFDPRVCFLDKRDPLRLSTGGLRPFDLYLLLNRAAAAALTASALAFSPKIVHVFAAIA